MRLEQLRSDLRYALSAWGASLRAALEYRTAFVLQAGFMLLNNLIFLSFWAIFFERFPAVAGWELPDVALLFATSATGFGLAVVLMGGFHKMAPRIARGDLDTWLLRSRPVLLQACTAEMMLSGFGDIASGLLLVGLSGRATPARVGIFLLMALVSATVATCFGILCNSAAFFLGRADDLAWQSYYALLTFSLYPPGLFGGWVRVILYVVIPAGLLSYLPASLVRSWDHRQALYLLGGVVALAVVTGLVWRAGLRRYESGNLTQAGQL